MHPVVVAPRARRDVETAARWYDRQRDGLGDEFVEEVAAALALLASNPERFPVVQRDLRRSPVDRFPYALTFRLVSGTARRRLHASQAPPPPLAGTALTPIRPWPRRTRST